MPQDRGKLFLGFSPDFGTICKNSAKDILNKRRFEKEVTVQKGWIHR